MLILKTRKIAIQIPELIIAARFTNWQLYLLPLSFPFLDAEIGIILVGEFITTYCVSLVDKLLPCPLPGVCN